MNPEIVVRSTIRKWNPRIYSQRSDPWKPQAETITGRGFYIIRCNRLSLLPTLSDIKKDEAGETRGLSH